MSVSPYSKRLAISVAIVVGVSSLILLRGSLRDAVTTTWFWFAVVLDLLRWSTDVHPAVFASLTAVILAAAATRRSLSIAATGWFVLNVLGGLWFLSVYDGHS
jgi:hypothetical protein